MLFKEFTPGMRFVSPVRVITGEDIDAFVALSGLDLPMFMDDAEARKVGHSSRIAPAPFQLSVAMGLARRTGVFDHVLAVAGFDDMRFLRPVHIGDGFSVEIEVLSTRPLKREDAGLVMLAYRGMVGKQMVMETTGAYLMRTSGEAS